MKTYKILFQENKKLSHILVKANSIEEVELPPNTIDIKVIFDFRNIELFKRQQILELVDSLNTVLEAKIPLAQALEILKYQDNKPFTQDLIDSLERAPLYTNNQI
jgi:type II secretory pathway component PulF